MIRTLQDHGFTLASTSMEFTVCRSERRRAHRRQSATGSADVSRSSRPKAVLATGGIGRAYRITSNSWEGTGDGALAYFAGAELMDMEFVSSIRPAWCGRKRAGDSRHRRRPRGEGGVLRNSKGRRFMFDIRNQTADNPDEGWRYTQGDERARPPGC